MGLASGAGAGFGSGSGLSCRVRVRLGRPLSPQPSASDLRHSALRLQPSALNPTQILRRAMHNLRHRYVWVGVLERFEESLRLLRTLLPTYFGGVHVAQANREHLT